MATCFLGATVLAAVRADATARTDAYGDPLPPGALVRLGTVRWRACARFLAFTPDSKTLVTGEMNGPEMIRFWDATTGKATGSYYPASTVSALAVCPDGKALVFSQSHDTTAALLFVRMSDGKDIRRIEATAVVPGRSFCFNRLIFSRDGKALAASGNDGVVRVWDAANGKEILREQEEGVSSSAHLTFSPDGKNLAVASLWTDGRQYNTLRLLEVATGRELFKRELEQKEDTGAAMVGFSPDGKKLLWVGEDARSFALRDVLTGEPLITFRIQEGTVRPVAFSPDGKYVVSAESVRNNPTSLLLWDAATGKEIRKLATSAGDSIGEPVFSPDGGRLAASGDYDGLLHVWDVETGKDLARMGQHEAIVCSVGFAPDGRTAFTGCADRAVRVWDADKGTLLRRIEVGENAVAPWAYEIAFSKDRRVAAVAAFDDNASLWDLDLGKRRASLDGGVGGASLAIFAPDGKILAAWGPSTGRGVQFWDAATGKKASFIKLDPTGLRYFTFAPDGKTFVMERNGSDNQTMEVSFWDVALGMELRKWSAPIRQTPILLLSPNGRMVAMGGSDGVSLRDATTGKELVQLLYPQDCPKLGWLNCLAISPSGETMAAGGVNGVVYLWEIRTAKIRAVFLGHHDRVTSLDFSPDGARLLSGSNDTTALIWDLTDLADDKSLKSLTPERLATLWDDLADADAGKAWRAGWRLTADPAASVPFLAKHVRPAGVDAHQLAHLVAALDSDDFTEREKASRDLADLDDLAGPAIQKALGSDPSPEARRRLEELAGKLGGPVTSPGQARALRCVEVLEHIGTAEARGLLDELGKGASGSRLTEDAKAALDRLAKAPARPSRP